jgi:hypothetical protein
MIIIIIILCFLKILRVKILKINSNSKIFKKPNKFQVGNKDLFQLFKVKKVKI